MYKKFRNRKSPRKKDCDYTTPGDYFVTICTKNWGKFFGKIKNKEMHLSDAGKIAEKIWLEIPDHFADVELGEFVVMPDHMHGIIRKGHALSVRPISLSTVIGSFKSEASKDIHKILPEFEWHVSFHDRIIRNSNEYTRISKYIINNPRRE